MLLTGIGGAVVLGALAGVRRTESAYPRFVASHRAGDVIVPGANPFGLIGGVDLGEVARLPEVDKVVNAWVALLFSGKTDTGRALGPADMFPVAPVDSGLGNDLEQWHLLRGRRADPERDNEVVLSFLAAERLHLDVGDQFTLRFFRAGSFPEVSATLLNQFGERLQQGDRSGAEAVASLADGPEITFRIVGVEASPAEFPPLTAALAPPVHLTPAFHRLHQAALVGTPLSVIKLHEGVADLPSFKAAVERLAQGRTVSFVSSRDTQTAKVQRAIDIEATAGRLLAGVTALAVAVVLGQALLRQSLVAAENDDVLRALGLTSPQLFTVAMIRAAFVSVAGAALAVGGAIVASPLAPIGLARIAETDHGVRLDPLVLGAGFVATLVGVLLLAVPGAYRVSRLRGPVLGQDAGQGARLPVGALPASASVGVRFAFYRGRGPAAVPVVTTLVGVAVATAILVGVTGFNASLKHLLDTPQLYGWNWSAYAGAPALPDLGETLTPALRDDRSVRELAVGTVTQVTFDGVRADTLAIDQTQGQVAPPIVAGRAPRSAGEVALGARTLRSLGKKLGDTVGATIGIRTMTLKIVGRAVLPDIGDAGQLGTGSVMTFGDLNRLLDDARRNVFLIRFQPGTDERQAFSVVRSALAPVPTRLAERPADLVSITRVDSLPNVLTLVLTGLAAAVLAHTVLTSVRRRRRDLAVLKSLGFVRRQVSLAVLWQASVLTAAAVLAGIPLGIAVGKWSWTIFANQLGIVSEPVVNVPVVLLTLPLAIVAANALSALPSMIAARTPAAVVLRTE